MEDSHIHHLDIVPGVHCFGVFDGHGGKEVALYVQKHFQEVLKKSAAFTARNWGQALEDTFFGLDELMRADKKGVNAMIGESEDNYSMAGCTATCIIISEDEIVCANAGDSRTVLS